MTKNSGVGQVTEQQFQSTGIKNKIGNYLQAVWLTCIPLGSWKHKGPLASHHSPLTFFTMEWRKLSYLINGFIQYGRNTWADPPQSLPFQNQWKFQRVFFFFFLHSMAYSFMWPRGKGLMNSFLYRSKATFSDGCTVIRAGILISIRACFSQWFWTSGRGVKFIVSIKPQPSNSHKKWVYAHSQDY